MKSQGTPKVFVALSGGVDSSVAAALLKERGFDVVGAHMKCWSEGDYCTSERDAEDARQVAEKLGIPFYVFDLEFEYRDRVFAYLLAEYAAGRTPNPDVLCNSEIKFGVFLDKALSLGASFIATGHYVRGGAPRRFIAQTDSRRAPAARRYLDSRPDGSDILSETEPIGTAKLFRNEAAASASTQPFGENRLFKAKDTNKDQSYFLWRLTPAQISRALFPVGHLTKPEVRALAKKFGLPTAAKKDSQGLCFVGDVKFADFMREHLPRKRGDVVTTSGKKIGEHDGVHFYTIGQRHGLKIGGGTPYYVASKNLEANVLTVAEGAEGPELYVREITASDANWLSGAAPAFPLECEARIRYRQPLQRCRIEGSPTSIRVVFYEPQRAATAGQSIVFYRGDEMLGGGVIT